MLLFVDGFDHYNTKQDLSLKWTSNNVAAGYFTTGRFGYGQCFYRNYAYWFTYTLPGSRKTIIAGGAFKSDEIDHNHAIFAFRDIGTNQCECRTNSDGTLRICRNGTTLATSTKSLTIDTWYYIEFKATIDNSSGYAEVRVNGENWVDFTGDTQNTSNDYITNVFVSCLGSVTWAYNDDIYICDNLGNSNNDFLGDVRIESLFVDADGSTTDWSVYPTGTSNYENVDETTNPDEDTSYNYSNATGTIDLYDLDDLTLTGDILGVQQVLFVRKDDAGDRYIRHVCRVSGTNYLSDIVSANDSYDWLLNVFEVSPYASGTWDVVGLNNAEWGIKLDT